MWNQFTIFFFSGFAIYFLCHELFLCHSLRYDVIRPLLPFDFVTLEFFFFFFFMHMFSTSNLIIYKKPGNERAPSTTNRKCFGVEIARTPTHTKAVQKSFYRIILYFLCTFFWMRAWERVKAREGEAGAGCSSVTITERPHQLNTLCTLSENGQRAIVKVNRNSNRKRIACNRRPLCVCAPSSSSFFLHVFQYGRFDAFILDEDDRKKLLPILSF